MTKLMRTAAMLTVIAAPAFADDAIFVKNADRDAIRASDFIGQRVYAAEGRLDGDAYDGAQDDWNDVGEINDVIIDRDGEIDAVLVDIGGFLGIGEKQIAMDMDELRFVADSSTADDEYDYFLVVNAAKTAFEDAPAFEWNVDEKMAQAGAAVEGAARDATTTVEKTADETVEEAEKAVDWDGYAEIADEDLGAVELKGARVYDASGDWIGEVSELHVDGNGMIKDAVIDVGGFLGIGEKPVALGLQDMKIMRETDGDDLAVWLTKTEEQLEKMPTYQK